MFIPKNVFKCYNMYRKLYLYILMLFCSFELLEQLVCQLVGIFCPTTEKVFDAENRGRLLVS